MTLHNSTFVVTCVYRDHEMESWHGYWILCLLKEVLPGISLTWFQEFLCALLLVPRDCRTVDKQHTSGWPGRFLAQICLYTMRLIWSQNSDKDIYVKDVEFRETHTWHVDQYLWKMSIFQRVPKAIIYECECPRQNVWVIWYQPICSDSVDPLIVWAYLPNELFPFTIYKLQTSC